MQYVISFGFEIMMTQRVCVSIIIIYSIYKGYSEGSKYLCNIHEILLDSITRTCQNKLMTRPEVKTSP